MLDGRELAQNLFTRKVAQATSSTFWASEHLAKARGVSPKRDPAWAPASFFELLPRRRGLAWARPFGLSEELGETMCLCGYFWNSEMVYACLGVDYCVKCMRQINMHEWCDSWIINEGFGREPSHVKGMRWLVLKWHGIGMRWNSSMLVENDELVWIHWKMKEMDYEELVCDVYV